jgi:hypothetical protein
MWSLPKRDHDYGQECQFHRQPEQGLPEDGDVWAGDQTPGAADALRIGCRSEVEPNYFSPSPIHDVTRREGQQFSHPGRRLDRQPRKLTFLVQSGQDMKEIRPEFDISAANPQDGITELGQAIDSQIDWNVRGIDALDLSVKGAADPNVHAFV